MRNVLYTLLSILFVGSLMAFSVFRVKLAEEIRDQQIQLVLDSGISLIDPEDSIKKVDSVEIPEIMLEVVKPKDIPKIEKVPVEPKDVPVEPKDIPVVKPVKPKPVVALNPEPDVPITIDYAPVLDERQAKRPKVENMNWRRSVVDLLKLIWKPFSRDDRKKMAEDFGYDGPDGSFERNVWLHRQVKKKLETGEIPLGK